MKNRFILSLPILAVSSFNLFAQTPAAKDAPILKDATSADAPATFSVGEARGAVNTKAVYIPRPKFPLEAREAGAEGAVRVEIMIDEEGNVIAANAVSGHQLLKAAAEEAALKAKFRINRDGGGNAVKTSGFLVFNFAVEKSGWTRIGFELAGLEKVRLLPIQIPAIVKALAPEWTPEREMLGKLEEIARRETPTPTGIIAAEPPPLLRVRPNLPSGTAQKSATLERRLILPTPPPAEQIALAQSLVSALQSRLGNNEKDAWQFNTGINLGKALQLYRNPNERAAAVSIARQSAESAPPEISLEVLSALKNLAQIFEMPKKTIETDGEIRKALAVILNGK